jgi:hypothetical protein
VRSLRVAGRKILGIEVAHVGHVRIIGYWPPDTYWDLRCQPNRIYARMVTRMCSMRCHGSPNTSASNVGKQVAVVRRLRRAQYLHYPRQPPLGAAAQVDQWHRHRVHLFLRWA